MRILHIFNNSNAKFSEPYIDFINKNFNQKNHLFILIGTKDEKKVKSRNNVKILKDLKKINNIIFLLKRMYESEKIILHSLYFFEVRVILFFQPWLLKKCFWTIWGWDLYYYKFREKNLRTNLNEFIRKRIIKNVKGLITYIQGDFELAKRWYGAKGKFFHSFLYPSNLYKEPILNESRSFKKGKYILIGNSADPSNNHIDAFRELEKIDLENATIFCPLTYGDNTYREKVIFDGKKRFENKFKPLVKHLSLTDYLRLLEKIDIGIFAHKRQQAMGNIITLIGFGKKVFIRDDTTTFKFCKEKGLKVYNLNKGLKNVIDEMNSNEKNNNIEIIKNTFSERKLIEDWDIIFKYK